ncbi:MAG: hypothetical protein DRJ65_05180 [Acidobacteria bacterium]|nr:MAG: hypothetical protein DRJ65_05180 [Acidobacteriota bacterium]
MLNTGQRDYLIFFVRSIFILLVVGSLFPLPGFSAEPTTFTIEIQGSSRSRENYPAPFVAFIPDRPIHEDEEGYSPVALAVGGNPLNASWQSPIDLIWDFGDGTAAVTIRERVSVSHAYRDEGDYTITVTARDRHGIFATGTHAFNVRNKKPDYDRLCAVEIDPETSTVEFTASAQDVDEDPLLFDWDFGDGETTSGEDLWKVRHQYLLPGEYEVSVTFTDDDGGERVEKEKVRVFGAATKPGSERSEIDGSSASDVVTTGLLATVNGAVSADFVGEVRSFRGIYLQEIASGACRFMFTAWDDANLAYIYGITDLFGVPPEGAQYKVSNPGITIVFEPTAEAYAYAKRTGANLLGSLGVGGMAEALLEGQDLTESQKKEVGERAGVEAKARQPGEPVPMPATSPLGIEEKIAFQTAGGQLELTFIPGERAIGDYSLVLKASEHGPIPNETISFDASFALDLVAARRDGFVNYDGCEPPPFDIRYVWPKDETEHLRLERPPVRVDFIEKFDPATVDTDTFEVGYTDPSGQIVPAVGRILRDEKFAFFVPDEPLLPGVRYTARIKAGDEGVRSRGGSTLDDSQGNGWRSWHFTTKLDFTPESDEGQLLSCHLFQSARDVPLIPGKPAIARVYASWERQPEVHADHQVKDFETRVVLTDADGAVMTSEWHKFVRPDLWEERKINIRAARHTAQITGLVPTNEMETPLHAFLEVRTKSGEEMQRRYRTRCPVEIWDQSPNLTVDFVALPIGEWGNDPTLLETAMPSLQAIADASLEYAWQLFPVAEITGGPVRVLPLGVQLPADCDAGCLLSGGVSWHVNGGTRWQLKGCNTRKGKIHTGLNDWLSGQSSADIIVAFGPHLLLGGGATGSRLQSGRGVVLILGGPEPEFFSRYVNGLVHEIGHVLGLEHLPYIANGDDAQANRDAVLELRDGSLPFEYKGIEGLLMSRDGQTWWNKSSLEGNQESESLAPLMFPGTLPTDAAFIANHHYRKVQRLLERLN